MISLCQVQNPAAGTVFFASLKCLWRFTERRLTVRTAARGGSPNGGWRFIQPMRSGSATVVIIDYDARVQRRKAKNNSIEQH